MSALAKPFILRSEMKPLSDVERSRRNAMVAELTPEEIERITGATNCNTIAPNSWNNSNGQDEGCDK